MGDSRKIPTLKAPDRCTIYGAREQPSGYENTRISGGAMFVKMPRALLLFEAMLLVGAVLALAYKAAMRILPLPAVAQRVPKVDPQTKILEYYRQFPERYIRIIKESWQYDEGTRSAYHTLTLKNSATVAYRAIEVRFSYESSGGKPLKSEVVKITGPVAALGTLDVKKIQVRAVPASSERVTAAVTTARVVQ